MEQQVNKFQKLRERINELENAKNSFSKSFSGVLFDPPPWYLLENLKCHNRPDIIAQPEISTVGSSDSSVDGKNFVMEHDDLQHCGKCPKELIDKIAPQIAKIDKISNTKILFVADFPKGPKSSIFSPESDALFGKIIAAMKLKDDEFAFTSIVKCQPALDLKENFLKLASNCLPKLYQEIAQLRPEVVVTLGATPINLILETEERLTNIHGKFYTRKIVNHEKQDFNYKLVPIFHPDFLLINPNMKKTTWIDLKKIMKYIGK